LGLAFLVFADDKMLNQLSTYTVIPSCFMILGEELTSDCMKIQVVGIPVKDQAQALAFYTEKLDFVK